MRNVVCFLLLTLLCSNECNAPYKAKMQCWNGRNGCNFRFHNSLEFLMNGATVSWWKGSLEIGIYYRGKNTSGSARDSLDYGRFSMVCSSGIKFSQAHKAGAGTVHTYAPAKSLDTAFLFFSADKYSKHEGMEILKKERFFLLYSDGATDTLLSVTASDLKIK